MSMIALDTETTGVDFFHSAQPFFVTTCDKDGIVTSWCWDVDPVTREVQVVDSELEEVCEVINGTDNLIGQNLKFDIHALGTIGITDIDWSIVDDTLLAAHLLESNRPHDLGYLALRYLNVNIQKYEDRLEEAVKHCRRRCRAKNSPLRHWKIARDGYANMPSIKSGKTDKQDRAWKYDSWLPIAFCKEMERRDKDYSKTGKYGWFWNVTEEYANHDSQTTILVWLAQRKELKRRGLWDIYQARRKILPIVEKWLETRGVSINGTRILELGDIYRKQSSELHDICVNIAKDYGYDLSMPKGSGANTSLRDFIFDHLKLEKRKGAKSKTDAPSLDNDAMTYYKLTLHQDSMEYLFVSSLLDKRSIDKKLDSLSEYRRFGVPVVYSSSEGNASHYDKDDWLVIHSSFNPTATVTLRWSSRSPNLQNLSTKEDESGRSIRYCFGPMPGREWWSLDAKNLELRIPAYESDERDFIDLFERPDEPPYFGSNHLMIAHILYTKEFESCINDDGIVDGRLFKKRFLQLYKRVKNGDFAVQYGGVNRGPNEWSTADRAYGIRGAQTIIESKLSKLAALNKHWVKYSEKTGQVETLPDRTVDPNRGYPLLVARSEWGKVLPTTPFNYHVQGTACWILFRAMVKAEELLKQWRAEGCDCFMAFQVHDEVVFDFPYVENKGNLPKIRELQKVMESCGMDLIPAIPTPFSIEYNQSRWDKGETCK